MKYFSYKEINSANLLYNYNYLKAVSQKNICAVVKANAYGHGIKSVCKCLNNSVNFFAVENLEEAIEVRKINKQAKVLILGYCKSYAIAFKNNISVMVDCLEELYKIIKTKAAVKKVHIKINTGMNRLGISNKQTFLNLIAEINKNTNIEIEGVFSHFLASHNNDVTNMQFKRFERYLKLLPITVKPIIHVGGGNLCFFKLPAYVNMVRCGLLLYGYGNTNVKKVLTIKSKIIKLFNIKKGEYVGYDMFYKSDKKTTIGVIPLGYADGIDRKLQKRIRLCFNKHRFKIVGKICMDMFMIDVSKLKIKAGSEIVVFEDANLWGKILNKTEYEVLTSFNKSRLDFKIV